MQNARAEADGLARQTVRSLEATLESVQVSGRTLAEIDRIVAPLQP